jgi:hypothetical protein
MNNKIPLTRLASALETLSGQAPPPYRRLHLMVLDGTIPAKQFKRQWYIKRADLRGIAETLGMAIPVHRLRGRTWASGRMVPPTPPNADDFGDNWIE